MSGTARIAEARPTVAIVGGGLSGAVCAHQLARRAPGHWRIVVVEPRAELGRGVAYSTEDPAHRINVPAAKMSFVPSDPCHFDRWLKADRALRDDPEALTADGRAFPRRAVFGRYAAETIEPYLLSGAIEHRRARALSIQRSGGGYVVALEDGDALHADAVALAATHPSPAAPRELEDLAGDPRLIGDTQDRAALDGVARDDRVLIVGTGLTMADIVASLEERGHRGPIVAVSRRGLLSRGHADPPGEFGDFSTRPSRTARDLVRRVRRAVAAAEAEGGNWRHALDAVRTQGTAIWSGLDEGERQKAAQRLRPFWDVHRFRVAPQVEGVVARLQAEGRLTVLTGRIVSAETQPDSVRVDFRLRSGAQAGAGFDRIALATGPAHNGLIRSSRLFANLAQDGLITADAYGLGLATDETSRSIGADDAPVPSFWIVGPLARGAFGELMGVPEVPRHGEFVAGQLARLTAVTTPASALEVA